MDTVESNSSMMRSQSVRADEHRTEHRALSTEHQALPFHPSSSTFHLFVSFLPLLFDFLHLTFIFNRLPSTFHPSSSTFEFYYKFMLRATMYSAAAYRLTFHFKMTPQCPMPFAATSSWSFATPDCISDVHVEQ
jgi:hypothetical protein